MMFERAVDSLFIVIVLRRDVSHRLLNTGSLVSAAVIQAGEVAVPFMLLRHGVMSGDVPRTNTYDRPKDLANRGMTVSTGS